MTKITGHCLNSVFGSNAGGLAVSLVELAETGACRTLFDTTSDPGGRLNEEVTIPGDPQIVYELRYATADFLAADGTDPDRRSIVPEIVFRFRMPDPDAHYHFSMAFTPGSSQVLAVVL